nr:hypothetical protein [Streptomyces sp. QL37]PPQ59418.1 hypothetical protein C5F59_24170 [Streptomyces sp. QL37]
MVDVREVDAHHHDVVPARAALGIALLLFLIIKVRLQPFVALLAVSIAVGLPKGLLIEIDALAVLG